MGVVREVPYTEGARATIRSWLELRALIAPKHSSPWLNLWSTDGVEQALAPDAFNRMLRTYVGEGWTLRRLRDTCAANWLNAGLPLEHVQTLLGLDSLAALLPYARRTTGTAEARLARIEPTLTSLLATE